MKEYERKKLKKQWQNYASTLSQEQAGNLIVELYTKNDITYKTLACIFDCDVIEIINYLKLVDIKRCTQCKEIKSYYEFHIAEEKSGGYQSHCKDCAYIKRKNYYENGPIEQRIKSRQWKDENRERVNFVENIRRKRPDVKQKSANYMKNRIDNDPKFKIKVRFSNLIYYYLTNRTISKNNQKWENLVGYTLNHLKIHLESKFDDKMNWDNYGSYWHIDHIVPESSFKYSTYEDESFKKCWSLENLQPLKCSKNIQKSNQISEEWNNIELAEKLLN